MAYFGASYTQVVEELQGADTSQTIDPDLYGGQAKIEEIMAQEQDIIISYLPADVSRMITLGKVEGHRVIDNCQNLSQTAVDKGQEFFAEIDVDTLRVSKNEVLDNYTEGISEFSVTDNVLSITAVKERGDIFRAYYSFDPQTFVSGQLARLLIKMTAFTLAKREIIGGMGDGESLTDFWQTVLTEINENLESIKQCDCASNYVSSLLGMNLEDTTAIKNTAKFVKFSRSSGTM